MSEDFNPRWTIFSGVCVLSKLSPEKEKTNVGTSDRLIGLHGQEQVSCPSGIYGHLPLTLWRSALSSAILFHTGKASLSPA
jgi:hypothetical protein